MNHPPCECGRPFYAAGMCQRHYDKHMRRNADPSIVLRKPFTIAKFWAHVDKDGEGGCWLWTGQLNYGYGYMPAWPLSPQRAHRFSYELLVGPIPEGLTLDHLCRVRHCVNPTHLEPCTSGENTLRGDSISAINARRTHCKWGHPFDEANTVFDKRGRRRCVACNLRVNRRLRAAALAEAGL